MDRNTILIMHQRVEARTAAGHLRAMLEYIPSIAPSDQVTQRNYDELKDKVEEFLGYLFNDSIIA